MYHRTYSKIRIVVAGLDVPKVHTVENGDREITDSLPLQIIMAGFHSKGSPDHPPLLI